MNKGKPKHSLGSRFPGTYPSKGLNVASCGEESFWKPIFANKAKSAPGGTTVTPFDTLVPG